MRRRPLAALAIAVGLTAAPAADAARSCVAMPAQACPCCGPAELTPGCGLACSPGDERAAAASAVLHQPSTCSPSKALAAAWLVTDGRWPERLTSRVGATAPGASPSPPLKRYLLACVLRL